MSNKNTKEEPLAGTDKVVINYLLPKDDLRFNLGDWGEKLSRMK